MKFDHKLIVRIFPVKHAIDYHSGAVNLKQNPKSTDS